MMIQLKIEFCKQRISANIYSFFFFPPLKGTSLIDKLVFVLFNLRWDEEIN